ncbi:MAG: methyltransferase domain-containing protein [Bacteroidia bacterium]|jgi:2-polyprenyl-3-methyl-5-hydroxy-6-metoxy-1,4-benzoquinol methylase|nr:methyltransferase domain-containing protein [Bacteroidia bacterium]
MLSEIQEYLKGTKFSNGLIINFKNKLNNRLLDRVKYLGNIVENKRVIHVGCCDHIPLIQKKIDVNRWLHQILNDSAKEVCGIDIDNEAIEYAKSVSGCSNIINRDIIQDDLSDITDKKWDFILLGEILEHTTNPNEFLSKIHQKFKGSVKSIIVTVPNSLRLKNFKMSLKNKEFINSDHKYEFTPYTLAKALTLSGFKVQKMETAFYDEVTNHGFFHKILYKKYPMLRDDLIIVGDF